MSQDTFAKCALNIYQLRVSTMACYSNQSVIYRPPCIRDVCATLGEEIPKWKTSVGQFAPTKKFVFNFTLLNFRITLEIRIVFLSTYVPLKP